MKLIILGEAEREFAESVAYYESKEQPLGLRFRDEVVATVDRIQRNPELPPIAAKRISTLKSARFPSLYRLRNPR